jgi:predicted HAD superfamily Cof-like phosphohydrolase
VAAIPDSIEVPIRLRSFDLPINLQLNVTANLDVEMENDSSNFDDVGDFHAKHGLPVSGEPFPPHLLSRDLYEYRRRFLHEELEEFEQAVERGDLPGAFDALLDLAYVVFGTAHLMSLPWQAGWVEVQRANMAKVRAESAEESAEKTGRGHAYDVVKPEGWEPPRIREVLLNHGWEGA